MGGCGCTQHKLIFSRYYNVSGYEKRNQKEVSAKEEREQEAEKDTKEAEEVPWLRYDRYLRPHHKKEEVEEEVEEEDVGECRNLRVPVAPKADDSTHMREKEKILVRMGPHRTRHLALEISL